MLSGVWFIKQDISPTQNLRLSRKILKDKENILQGMTVVAK